MDAGAQDRGESMLVTKSTFIWPLHGLSLSTAPHRTEGYNCNLHMWIYVILLWLQLLHKSAGV